MLARSMVALVFAVVAGLSASVAVAQNNTPGDPTIAEERDGKYFDADGTPTFKFENGQVDWYTFSGYRRYHAACHVCHGPDGLGSSYAPALAHSLEHLDYANFLAVVAGGRENVSSSQKNVMPSFGTNPNVMCYIDDIYIYLRARAQGDLPRGRPPKKEKKPDSFMKAENDCLGT
ncbi:c-type cytochrome, methanol metabolism-related [Afifella sp. JA880]|uniref:c-type cytochrome, methanol metabolism-related n=1 Tax=Afifella sp. JA880 TaxID=2975280 RepID=UPI0021BADB45|nr:c-type cytochrome, methanol metabolism-related [Afifella sp. JA880]MCT8266342.1 c-type cytochrome, methanol metabolism-related [Afifella sp. JA880]